MNVKWIAFLGVMFLSAQTFGGEQQVLRTQKDRENYSTGVEFVRNLKQQGGAVNLDIVVQGIKDGLLGEKLLLTESEIRTSIAARLGGKTGQREEVKADATNGTVSETMSAGRDDAPATPNKQEPALPRIDQAEQNSQLASLGLSGGPGIPAANAGSGSYSVVPKSQARPEQVTEQGVQSAPSSATPSNTPATKGSGSTPVIPPTQGGPEQNSGPVVQLPPVQLPPNGMPISKRNRAKLSVAEQKREMRTAILSGELGQ